MRKNRVKKRNNRAFFWMMALGTGLILLSLALFFSNFPSSNEQSSDFASNQFTTIPIEVNYIAPEINLTDLNTIDVSLTDYFGRIVLVNNWATWCPPCKAEMPTLQTYYDLHKNEGFVIVAIESGESLEEVSEFVSEHGITFPVWIDRAGEALIAFKNRDLPSSYVIDKTGTVRLRWTGEINLDMLEKFVTPLLHD